MINGRQTTYREGLEENEALYDALHGVSGETESSCEVSAFFIAYGGRGR